MWIWLVLIIQVIIDTLLHLYFFNHCLVARKTLFVGKILPFTLFVSAELVFFQLEQSVMRPLLSIVFCVIIVSICYSDKFTVKVFAAIFEIAIMLTIEMIFYVLLAVVLGDAVVSIYALKSFHPLVVMLRFLYQIVLLAALCLYVHLWIQRKIRKGHCDFWAFVIILFVQVGLVISVLKSYSSFIDRNTVMLMLLAVVAGIVSDVMMVSKMEESVTRNLLSEQLKHVETIRDMEFRYYCRLKDEIQRIRDIRHDALNQIQSIGFLMQGTRVHMQYANEMAAEFKNSLMISHNNNLYCQNDMLDYILSEYVDSVENKKLYEIWIDASQDRNIPWMDMCILIITLIVEFTRKNISRLSHVRIRGTLTGERLELTTELQMYAGKIKLKDMNEIVESLKNIAESNCGSLWTDYLQDENKYVWYIY